MGYAFVNVLLQKVTYFKMIFLPPIPSPCMPSLHTIDTEPPVYKALNQAWHSEVIWIEMTADEIGIFPEDAHSLFRVIADMFFKELLSPS